jgi:hypothetical protein
LIRLVRRSIPKIYNNCDFFGLYLKPTNRSRMKATCLFPLILLAVLMSSCSKDTLNSVPPCIKDKIVEIKNDEVQNPPAEVWEWKSGNQIFYYFTSGCCDQYNYLYNSECEVVCAPDGGFTGAGSGDCPSFVNNVEKKLIWKDPR